MYEYAGNELDVFKYATRWKSYYGRLVKGYLGESVLEVGAGIGATTHLLCDGSQHRWVCLEPDAELARRIENLPRCCEVRTGTVADIDETFASVLYIDVLEHIEDDVGELRRAAKRLGKGGHLVVLSPAHQWLYTPFDKRIGHVRRYDKTSLSAAAPPELECVRMMYLDSIGVLASAANRLLLRSPDPTVGQIKFWDRWMVPLSVVIDPLLRYHVGKSVLGVWRK